MGSSDNCAETFDDQMIKQYPIIKPTGLLSNLSVPNLEPFLKYYTHKATEDNMICFQELKCTVQGTDAKVYVDKFNVPLEI